jgi:hypothetical protein
LTKFHAFLKLKKKPMIPRGYPYYTLRVSWEKLTTTNRLSECVLVFPPPQNPDPTTVPESKLFK